MGGNTSKSSVQQVNEFFNQTTNSFVSENSNEVSAANLNTQTIKVTGSKFKNCVVDVTQEIEATTVSTGKMENKSIQDLSTALQNQAKTAIDNAATQGNGFFSTAIANSTEAKTDLKNTVTNIIDNTMKSTNVQKVFADARNLQDLDFSHIDMECAPQYRIAGQNDLVINQKLKSAVVAKGVADNITQALSQVIVDNTADTTVKQKADQKNAGLDDLIGALTSGWAMLVFAIIIILIILAMVGPKILAAMKGGGGNGGGNGNGNGNGK
jgi:hypothetical protein